MIDWSPELGRLKVDEGGVVFSSTFDADHRAWQNSGDASVAERNKDVLSLMAVVVEDLFDKAVLAEPER
jgi:hypothetical protein